jgi:flagellar basal-body rod protein FlgG
MIRGLYTSATGMNAGIKRQDVISNNLANAGTPGFKRQESVFQSLLEREIWANIPGQASTYIGQMGTGSNYRLGATDNRSGQFTPTDSTLDIALNNRNAYIAVDQNGTTAYTRNGQMQVDADGYLRLTGGAYLLGTQQRADDFHIRVTEPQQLVITADGILQDGQGQVIDRLQLAQFDQNASFTHLGDSLVTADTQALPVANPEVKQGFLEQSNVQVVKEMVNLIAAMRYYETNSKLIQMQDSTLDKAVNEVGRT